MASNTKRPLDVDLATSMTSPKKARFDPNVSPKRDTNPSNAEHSPSAASVTSNDQSSTISKRPKRYVCEYEDCIKAFDRPVRLQAHVRTHTNDRPFVCEEIGCSKSFFKREHLKAHLQNKHSDDTSFVCTYILSVNEEGEEFECGKTFTTSTRLKRHAAIHDKAEELKCHEIGCGQVFRKMETLQRHIKKEHLNEKPFRCDKMVYDDLTGSEEECGEEFSTVGQLKAHETREHIRMKHVCSICSPPSDSNVHLVAFPSYNEYQAHLKLVHPPTCSICHKACASNRALIAHMEIEHSSLASRKENFKCPYPECERGFTRKGNLNVHIQSAHVKKKFVCGEFDLSGSDKCPGWTADQSCGSGYTTKATLEGHVRTHHLGLPPLNYPRKSRKIKKEFASDTTTTPSSVMDFDEPPELDMFDGSNSTLGLLTGNTYANTRPIACWMSACPVRFTRDYDLAQHMELSHGWNVDDINDRLVEQEALAGGQFWIGGADDVPHYLEQDQEEEQLRASLSLNLRLEAMDVDVNETTSAISKHVDPVDSVEKTARWFSLPEDEEWSIDPMLATM